MTLTVERLTAAYGPVPVLHEVSLQVRAGELVALIGPNGAGKTTLLRALSGLLRAQGRIDLDGRSLAGLSAREIVRAGVVHCPEGRQLFGDMSVHENVLLGAHLRNDRTGVPSDLERVYTLFPVLKERVRQRAASLSGGEQQMLAIGRAIMSRPRVLLLDEPSFGLAPLVVERIFSVIRQLNREGLTALVVEQNAQLALESATRTYVLEAGRVVLDGPSDQVGSHPQVREAYLGM